MASADFNHYPFAGKRVLVRVDFNVPFSPQTGLVSDDTRIRRALPTIEHIVSRGGRAILISHLGRPKGQPKPEFSMQRIVQTVSTILGKHITFVPDCIGPLALQAVQKMHDGDIVLLENVRFHPEEEAKVKQADGEPNEAFAARKAAMKRAQQEFAAALASLGDCFVMDAFGAAHRAHASVAAIASHFPNDKMFGLLLASELEAMAKVLQHPARPLTAVMGGAKVSDKLTLIEQILPKVDRLLIGGGMAYTFALAQGGTIGTSICEPEQIATAQRIMEQAKAQGVTLLLPTDSVCAREFKAQATPSVYPTAAIPTDQMGMDIGPETVKQFSEAVRTSKTVFWNGPMGVFEFPTFAKGSFALAKALAEATMQGAFTLVGGGDSVAAIRESGLDDKVSFLSTGGGAMLEYLEGKRLPGVAAIED